MQTKRVRMLCIYMDQNLGVVILLTIDTVSLHRGSVSTDPAESGNFFSIQERKEGTSSAILLGKDELVMNLGMLPDISQSATITSRYTPPASLLVAIRQSTSAPPAASDTRSTETYFPRTVPASFPCLGGQSGCSNGNETVVYVSCSLEDELTIHETPLSFWFLLELPREKQHYESPRIGRWRGFERQPPYFGDMGLKDLKAFCLSHRFNIFPLVLS
jgi:hypothetical protein